jgi:hypothetical protein
MVKYNRELLNFCLETYKAQLVGECEKLKRETVVPFKCNCGTNEKKTFRSIYDLGMFCEQCTAKISLEKKQQTRINNLKYEDSLKSKYPEIADQWHPTKNGDLKPEHFSAGSKQKAWWFCDKTCLEGCPHEWEAAICNRTGQKQGCPYCSNNKLCIHTSIAHTHPEVAKQWHPTKNGDLKPEHFSAGSTQKAWWLCHKTCPEGCPHEWEAVICNRTKIDSPTGCPFCPNQKICIHTSIVHTHPEVAKQWHPTKNGDLKPEDVSAGSIKNAWWLCDKTCPEGCPHEWQTPINRRTRRDNPLGCHCCSNNKLCIHTSIAHTHPDIARQWHPTKNGDLKPEDVSAGSGEKAWWLCDKKCPEGCPHEWETVINSRTKRDNPSGCHCCSNNKLCIHTSIAHTHPEIAKQWHPTKNGDLKPEQFSAGSNEIAWWFCDIKCPEGCPHEWQTPINRRTILNQGCHCCSNNKLCIHTSIVYTHPELAKQWHPTKNGDLKPEQFSFGSGQMTWWLCDKTCPEGCPHEWEATISSRTERGCPCCSNRKLCIHTSIVHTHPEIAEQWHPTKNGDLKPEDVSAGSNKMFWWICNYNHEYQSMPNDRTNNHGCPYCKHKTERKLYEYLLRYFPDLIYRYRPDWCKNPYTNYQFEYDYYIPSINCIIELDGRGHFEIIKVWKNNPEINLNRDIYKMLKAKENGILNFIRILQEDVYIVPDEWLDKNLLPHLTSENRVAFLSSKDTIYDKHIELYNKGVMPELLNKEEEMEYNSI